MSTPKRSMWRVAQFDTLRLRLAKKTVSKGVAKTIARTDT